MNMNDAILDSLKQHILSGNIPQMIDTLLEMAVMKGASDVHLEPSEAFVRARLRIDGMLRVIVEYPLSLHSGVVSRLKIMSNLKIDETRIPQDGRINTLIGKTELDLRISTLPMNKGEKVVMRVLDKSKQIPLISELGITGKAYKRFINALDKPNGIILNSGPTGSGKTTTLYSAMAYLNRDDRNILTFEDPIENEMKGLNQSQVRPEIGYTFARGLRTALRQDPDIIMVGEIRDKETIDIAIEASLTGHLVLSTIHTNSAVETITRILNMKVPDFLLTSSINLILAQRLCRRLCENCSGPATISQQTYKHLQNVLETYSTDDDFDMNIVNNPILMSASKSVCSNCDGTGYKGRIPIFEILPMTEPIKHAILEGQPGFEITKLAIQEGMCTLEQDGIIKALEGKTSLEEVYKMVG